MSLLLDLSRIHFPVTALGPGQRIGIWFQGCSIRCTGCISVDTWASGYKQIPLLAALDLIQPWLPYAEGITITGGEPFDQLEALVELLQNLRHGLSPYADILVYTGYSLGTVLPLLNPLSDLIDGLVTEPYDWSYSQTLALRGSDNQQLHLLTPLGHKRLTTYNRQRNSEDDRLDVMLDEQGAAWLAGIPKRGDLERLRAILAEEGIQANTSEQSVVTP